LKRETHYELRLNLFAVFIDLEIPGSKTSNILSSFIRDSDIQYDEFSIYSYYVVILRT